MINVSVLRAMDAQNPRATAMLFTARGMSAHYVYTCGHQYIQWGVIIPVVL